MISNAKYANIQSQAIDRPVHPQTLCRSISRMILVLTDAGLVILAFVAAYWLRFRFGVAIAPDVQPKIDQYIRLTLALIPLWLVLFSFMRLYDFRCLLGGTGEYARVFNACSSGMMLVVIVSFLFPDFRIARAWLVLAWILSIVFVCSGRLSLRRIAYKMRRNGYFVSPAVVIGTNSEAVALAAQLRSSVNSGLAIIGFVAPHTEVADGYQPRYVAGLPVVGDLESLPEIICRQGIEEVIVAATALAGKQLLQLPDRLAACPGVELRLSSGLYEIFTTGMHIETKNCVPLMSIDRVRLDTVELALKTCLDYFLILCSLPFLLPLFATVSLLIKLDSPGPVFYRRRVLGIGGKEFDALKFRTMVVNGDEVLAQSPELCAQLNAKHKLENDPRVTNVGSWLRRSSLDELPQLINVLLGQMSLVGPRMITPEEKAEYGHMQFNLLTVKPGLTGLWQVSGRSDLSYTERVQLDMHYIRNYNLWHDLQILFFQTPPAILKRKGAY